jgi:hypothetical protein
VVFCAGNSSFGFGFGFQATWFEFDLSGDRKRKNYSEDKESYEILLRSVRSTTLRALYNAPTIRAKCAGSPKGSLGAFCFLGPKSEGRFD